jgi:hypothetical protein
MVVEAGGILSPRGGFCRSSDEALSRIRIDGRPVRWDPMLDPDVCWVLNQE